MGKSKKKLLFMHMLTRHVVSNFQKKEKKSLKGDIAMPKCAHMFYVQTIINHTQEQHNN